MNADDIDPSKITSWADFWNPEYKGKVLLTSDAREVFHIALLLDGKSPNTTNEEDIKAAYERLVKLLPNVVTFNSDSPEVPFVQGEASIEWFGLFSTQRKSKYPICVSKRRRDFLDG